MPNIARDPHRTPVDPAEPGIRTTDYNNGRFAVRVGPAQRCPEPSEKEVRHAHAPYGLSHPLTTGRISARRPYPAYSPLPPAWRWAKFSVSRRWVKAP
jgi:hypothetical protein